jgi:putative ABC transport system permease protein
MVKGRSAFGKNNRLEIAHTLGRYLAILAIVALGVGFFSGVKVSRSAMVETGDRYVQAHHLFDFRLLSTLGLTRQDVDAFAAMEGIAQAQGAVAADMIADVGDNTRSEERRVGKEC